jgi:hypothetical protein
VAAGLLSNHWFIVVRILLTFHLILLSWVFFRAASIDEAMLVLGKIAGGLPSLPAIVPHYPFTGDHLLGLTLIILLLAVEILDERGPVSRRLAAMPTPLRWSLYYGGLAGIVLLGRWQGAQFIYMQF